MATQYHRRSADANQTLRPQMADRSRAEPHGHRPQVRTVYDHPAEDRSVEADRPETLNS